MFIPIIQGLFAPQVELAFALNFHYEKDKDAFAQYAKENLPDFTISNMVWEGLSKNVKSELLKLGYKPKTKEQ